MYNEGFYPMGRWDEPFARSGSGGGSGIPRRWNRIRITKLAIRVGFIIVAVVFLSVFIPRYGLNIEIIQRSEAAGAIQTISVKISNKTLNNVIAQFGEKGRIQQIGNMGPFSSVMITPEPQDMNFDKIIVKAANGKIQSVKFR
jgi:hypothetical protein